MFLLVTGGTAEECTQTDMIKWTLAYAGWSIARYQGLTNKLEKKSVIQIARWLRPRDLASRTKTLLPSDLLGHKACLHRGRLFAWPPKYIIHDGMCIQIHSLQGIARPGLKFSKRSASTPATFFCLGSDGNVRFGSHLQRNLQPPKLELNSLERELFWFEFEQPPFRTGSSVLRLGSLCRSEPGEPNRTFPSLILTWPGTTPPEIEGGVGEAQEAKGGVSPLAQARVLRVPIGIENFEISREQKLATLNQRQRNTGGRLLLITAAPLSISQFVCCACCALQIQCFSLYRFPL
jgi:hypothetical protein